MKNYIEVYFEDITADGGNISKSLSGDSLVDRIIGKNKSLQIPKEVLNKNLSSVLDDVSEIFALSDDNPNCYIDEIEFGVNVGVEGKVTLVSVIGAGASVNSSMIIKLKRRKNDDR